MDKFILTVNLIVVRNKKILLVKRSKNEVHPNVWSIPGGSVKYGESLTEALTREIKEELDCTIIKQEWFSYYDVIGETHVHASYFVGDISGAIKLDVQELSEYEWFDFDKRLSQLDFAFNQKSVIMDLLDSNINKE